mmetsp:Transcript_15808/g.34637  ORF Transcript_15808/g.34637 Transcript_15808/m.34637 type:complete len:127 (+) Transcript_15808:586-966(+)
MSCCHFLIPFPFSNPTTVLHQQPPPSGPFGIGYYHLLTKQPYTILYTKHMNTAPNTCCTGTSGRQAKDEWDDVRIILFQRMNSTRRNEVVAHSDMMGNASTLAQYHYQFGQNVQLIHGVATPYTGS